MQREPEARRRVREPVLPPQRERQQQRTAAGTPLEGGPEPSQPLMILPQVHLRKPCYDFYFL